MARIRTIKPEFWKHEGLSELPEATHMLAAALINYADDHGYFNANPKLVQAECSPLREPSVSIPESLRSLQALGYIRLGKGADGRMYGHIVEFAKHQKVSHPTPSKIADLSITWERLGSSPEILRNPPETLRPEQGTGNREQGKDVPTSSGATAPDVASVVFGAGLGWLRKATGKPERDCRTLLGKWRRDHGDALLIEVLGAAQREGPIDAIAWIEKAFKRRGTGPPESLPTADDFRRLLAAEPPNDHRRAS